MRQRSADILVVGGGPCGMAAAVRAAESGARVTVVDDNPAAGGQIWRSEQKHPTSAQASAWFRKFENARAELISGARVVAGDAARKALLIEHDGAVEISYRKLILATGAREAFLPFPGWTLPNVFGVGGLQALVKSGLTIEGRRIVVAGSGPLLLAAAAYFRKHGGRVKLIAEQAPMPRLFRFGVRLFKHPGKLWQAISLKFALRTVRYLTGSWIEAANGRDRVTSVRMRQGQRTWTEDCDYVAVAYGFVPNVELASLLDCETENGVVQANEWQHTSMENIYCAGEATGIGGVDLSLVEGEIAGYAAAGCEEKARQLFGARRQARNFASALNNAFVLRDELRGLASADTLVCRCEDVTLGRLRSSSSWRSAKLHARCGMGPCQGRVCGPIVQFLFGWNAISIRPPLFPTAVGNLISEPTRFEDITT